jgi:hypothetical protein
MKICLPAECHDQTIGFRRRDESKEYCLYCARPDGSMQSYPEKLEGTTEFLIRTQGIDREAARELAVRTLAKLPAWSKKDA